MTTADLKQRVWGAGGKLWTILGLVAGFAAGLSDYLDLIPQEYKGKPVVVFIAGVVSFGLWFNRNFKKPDPAAPPEAPKGFVIIGLGAFLVAVSLIILLFGNVARADDVTPTQSRFGGGCTVTKTFGEICASPDVAVAVVAFRPEGPSAGVMPGAGYKGEIFAERWYTLGLGGYINLQSGSVSSGAVTGLFSFARYIRAGMAKDLYRPVKPYPVLGLGMDFGPSR